MQEKVSKKKWYKNPIIIVLLGIPFGISMLITFAAVIYGVATYDGSDNLVERKETSVAQQDTNDDEIIAAAEEITETLIEGYVPRYCENHQNRRIPLPYEKNGEWLYDTENPTTKLTNTECRNVVTYLVNNVGSSGQALESISEAKITIGMNRHELLLSWGVPNDVNSTHTTYGSSAQWVYNSSYVYLDGDIITAIQN